MKNKTWVRIISERSDALKFNQPSKQANSPAKSTYFTKLTDRKKLSIKKLINKIKLHKTNVPNMLHDVDRP